MQTDTLLGTNLVDLADRRKLTGREQTTLSDRREWAKTEVAERKIR